MKFRQRFFVAIISSLFLSLSLSAAEYKVAVRAHHGINDSFRQWQPTLDTLNEKLPMYTFILTPIISLKEISRRVSENEFDFVLTNPSSFVEMEQLYGAKALVTLNNKGTKAALDHFGAVIFTHVLNNDILTIKDLKDKTLMAVSEPAFGGWRVAWLEMLKHGFDPYSDLESLMFTKSSIQSDVVRAVRERKVDAGVVRTDRLERMQDDGEIDMRYFRIINNKNIKDFPFFLSTSLYPEWVFATAKSLPVEVTEKVKKTLLALHSVTAAAKAGKYFGWVTPRDYSSVQQLMKRLKVMPYAINSINRNID